MNSDDKNQKDDMSMEDILASIRKYVGNEPELEEKEQKFENFSGEDFISKKEASTIDLSKDDIVMEESRNSYQTENKNQTDSNFSGNPFGKLTEALKSYNKRNEKDSNNSNGKISEMSLEQLMLFVAKNVVQEWVNAGNLKIIVEEIIEKEIQKLKNV